MSRKILISILAFTLSLVCGSLLSSDTYAVGRIGSYVDYETNSNLTNGLSLNTRYQFGWTNRTSVYLRKGHFTNAFDWYNGNTYHLVITLNFYGNSFNVAGNEALRFESDYYTTENDEVSSTFSCTTECRYTIIHNITLRGIRDGNYYLVIPESNLISLFGINATDSVMFMWTGTLFYDDDEWAAVKDNIEGIYSDTTDIANLLDDIDNTTGSIDRNLQSIIDAQEQANDDANDRYQDEKDTIDSNTTDGIGAVDDIDTTINLPNILNFFLGSLSPNTCYDISTLAGMVGSSTTTYCSWFSSSTRTIMTPFVDVFVFVIVSMFIWSWVKKGGL